MRFSFKKLLKKVAKRTLGASIVFWKKENDKIYILMAIRRHNPGKGKYSNFGGHKDDLDYVTLPDGKKKYSFMNTAIRENAEETYVLRKKYLQTKAELDAAKVFFTQDGFELSPKVFQFSWLPYWYTWISYQCKVTGKMAQSKWYCDGGENVQNTMEWFCVDKLPEKICFEARRSILKLKFLNALKKL